MFFFVHSRAFVFGLFLSLLDLSIFILVKICLLLSLFVSMLVFIDDGIEVNRLYDSKTRNNI